MSDKVTTGELERLNRNPALMQQDGRCVCLIPECRGRIIKTHIDKHVARIHRMTWLQYEHMYPGALRAPTGEAASPIVKIQREGSPLWVAPCGLLGHFGRMSKIAETCYRTLGPNPCPFGTNDNGNPRGETGTRW
jgi:hypothetical protein